MPPWATPMTGPPTSPTTTWLSRPQSIYLIKKLVWKRRGVPPPVSLVPTLSVSFQTFQHRRVIACRKVFTMILIDSVLLEERVEPIIIGELSDQDVSGGSSREVVLEWQFQRKLLARRYRSISSVAPAKAKIALTLLKKLSAA
jgi:hypothetical protein